MVRSPVATASPSRPRQCASRPTCSTESIGAVLSPTSRPQAPLHGCLRPRGKRLPKCLPNVPGCKATTSQPERGDLVDDIRTGEHEVPPRSTHPDGARETSNPRVGGSSPSARAEPTYWRGATFPSVSFGSTGSLSLVVGDWWALSLGSRLPECPAEPSATVSLLLLDRLPHG